MGLFGDPNVNETWRKTKWNVSTQLKQRKIAKRKVELEKKNHENVKLKEEDVTGAISRKIRRMHRETAPGMASLPWSQNNRKENAARTKVSTRGLGSS